jgi:chorismate-pyruvate lyase
MNDFFKQLCEIQKLGEALRKYYPSWKISLIQESWQDGSWIREICHDCDDGPLVYAQTVIPRETYLVHETTFQTLGTKSIGDHFLFKHRNVRRSPFQCSVIDKKNKIYPIIAQHLGAEAQFYKRESIFHIGDNTLSISEYFGQKALLALGLDSVNANKLL